jgi:hypothetical protein
MWSIYSGGMWSGCPVYAKWVDFTEKSGVELSTESGDKMVIGYNHYSRVFFTIGYIQTRIAKWIKLWKWIMPLILITNQLLNFG